MKRWLTLPIFLFCPLLALADISFIAGATTSPSGTPDATVSVPTGTQENDVMVGVYSTGDDSVSSVVITGWTPIGCYSEALGVDVTVCTFYKVASGSEPANYLMDSTGSSSNVITGTIVTFRGVDTSSPLDVTYVGGTHSVKRQDDATPLPAPITTVTDGAWVLIASVSNNSTSVTDIVAPTNYSERTQTLANNRYSSTSTRAITTAGIETPGDITLTGGAATEETVSFTLALTPAASGDPLAFDTAPAVNDCDADSCLFDFESNAAATLHWAAYTTGAAAPADCDAVDTATGATDSGSDAVTDAADTVEIPSPFPEQDYYFCLDDGSTQTAIEDTLNQDRDARAGMEFVNLASVAATSVFDSDSFFDPDVAAGDIVEADSATTSGAFAITWETDGDFQYTDATGSRQSIDYCVQDVSDGTGEFTTPDCWTNGDDKIWINNSAPTAPSENFALPIVLTEDVSMSDVNICDQFEDADSDQLTLTVTSGTLPTGVTPSGTGNCVLTGTPTTEDEDGVTIQFTATDIAEDSVAANQDIYVINTITLGDYTAGTLDEAIAAHQLANPWQVEELALSASFTCSDEATNEVISQDPSASTEVTAFQSVSVSVSTGSACLAPGQGKRRVKGASLSGVSIN